MLFISRKIASFILMEPVAERANDTLFPMLSLTVPAASFAALRASEPLSLIHIFHGEIVICLVRYQRPIQMFLVMG